MQPPRREKPLKLNEKSVGVAQFIPKSWQYNTDGDKCCGCAEEGEDGYDDDVVDGIDLILLRGMSRGIDDCICGWNATESVQHDTTKRTTILK